MSFSGDSSIKTAAGLGAKQIVGAADHDVHLHDVTFRRIALRLLPFFFVCFVISLMDRTNIGFAKLQFLEDLHFNEAIFGLAASFLYIGYVMWEVPSNIMLQRKGVKLTFLRIMTLWGIFTMSQAFASNKYEFYALRYLIGAAEGGFFPGVLLYLTFWFPDKMRGRITSFFAMGIPVSGIIGGPLATWIMTSCNGVFGLRGWQALFLAEGIPSVVLGIVAYFYLANGPSTAGWLSEDEKKLVASQLSSDLSAASSEAPKSIGDSFKNPTIYGLAICYFAFFSLENAFLLWIPTLLKSIGVGKIMQIGWMSGGISVLATIGMLVLSYSSDRLRERRWHVIGCGIGGGLSFLLLPLGAHSAIATIILLSIAGGSIYGFLALFWTIPSAYLKGEAASSGIAVIASVGALGGIFSPALIGWIRVLTGSFYYAFGFLGAMFLLSMVLLYFCIPRAPNL